MSCFNVLFRVQHSAEDSLQHSLRMLRELENMKPPIHPSSIYDTINVILERKLNVPLKEFDVEVESALRVFEKKAYHVSEGPELARFYLNKILYAEYKKKHTEKLENIIPKIANSHIKPDPNDPSFRTPTRPKLRKPIKTESDFPVPKTPKVESLSTPKIPKSHRLGKLKKAWGYLLDMNLFLTVLIPLKAQNCSLR